MASTTAIKLVILTIVDSVVSNNWSGFTFGNPIGYGGIIGNGGTLTIIRSTISNNIAYFDGGGIYVGWDGDHHRQHDQRQPGRVGRFEFSGVGGGIDWDGIVEIRSSTISGNIASSKGSGFGGGIANAGEWTLTISNSTISGNLR